MHEPRSFLDFAILMALYYLQLHIIERVVTGEKPYSAKIEHQIERDNWSGMKLNKKVQDILDSQDRLH